MRVWTVPATKHFTIRMRSQTKREAEKVAKAIEKLARITSYRREFSGIRGTDSERDITYMMISSKQHSLADPQRYQKDVELLLGSIPETIMTSTAGEEIIKKAHTVFLKHVPTFDKRETPTEAAAREEKERQIHDELNQREEKERIAFLSEWGRDEKIPIPEGKIAVYLSITYDGSDIRADHFAPHCQIGHKLLLGLLHRGAKTQSLARSVLARYPELNRLSYEWHTENYSGGYGNYLVSKVITGLKMKPRNFGNHEEVDIRFEICFSGNAKEMYPYKNYYPIESGALSAEDNPSTSSSLGAEMRLNEAKNGVELRFSVKPSEEVISSLYAAGFRLSRRKTFWYARQSEHTLAFARGIVGGKENDPAQKEVKTADVIISSDTQPPTGEETTPEIQFIPLVPPRVSSSSLSSCPSNVSEVGQQLDIFGTVQFHA